jgi:hypothetical protein
MKKLLVAVLAISFCTADAGLWQKFKNKIKGTSSQQTQQTDTVGTWISNVQGILSNMASDVQEVVNNVMSWEIQNAATSLYTVINECFSDPFKIFTNKSAIDGYISTLQGKTQSNTQTQQAQTIDVSKLLTDYQNLSSVIASYNTTYVSNLDSILTTAKSIQTGWAGNPEISGYANQLISLSEACRSDLTKVSSNLEGIKQCVSQLSGKLGVSHVYINTLNNGITYLQTHVDLQQRSANLTSASAQTTATTSSVTSKLSTVINAVNTVKNLQNSTSNTTTGTTNNGTSTSSSGGINYQNLINTGMTLYNQYKNANSSTQTSN